MDVAIFHSEDLNVSFPDETWKQEWDGVLRLAYMELFTSLYFQLLQIQTELTNKKDR